MNYYLGVDIGTTSVKAVAFSEKREVLNRQQVAYSMQHPTPDRSELDPEEVVRAVCDCINGAAVALQGSLPVLLSFSSAMHSLLAIDALNRPLTACMIWADNRAGAIADLLRNSEQGKVFYRSTGVPVHAMTPLCKLLWLREAAPAIFNRADKFIGIKEYIFLRLFGEGVVDTPIASATGLLNLRTLEWDKDILSYAGIGADRLSKIVAPGYIISYDGEKAEPSVRLSVSPGTPIVIGGSDGASANLSTGATGDHIMAITIGTSGAARMVIRGARTDGHMRTFCYHVQKNSYILGGASNNGAVVIQWLKENLLQTDEDFGQLFALAATVGAGSEGLLFIPYILGERAPIWNSNARGIYFGLGISHGRPHLIRAAMEGVVYGLYSIGKVLMENKEIRELHATGGFTRSPLWLQMLADVFNIKVLVFGEDESSALGAVMTGLGAMGGRFRFPPPVLATYEPDAAAHVVYRKGWEQFIRVYRLVEGEFL